MGFFGGLTFGAGIFLVLLEALGIYFWKKLRRYQDSKRDETCDVRLAWWQNVWISTIFVERGGDLHCRTVEKKYLYGLPFCS